VIPSFDVFRVNKLIRFLLGLCKSHALVGVKFYPTTTNHGVMVGWGKVLRNQPKILKIHAF
jgi:hypothetical protein